MSFVEENKGWLIALAVVGGVSYFGGGAVTAKRHKGVITAGQQRFKDQFARVKVAFARLKQADKKLKRAHGRGWFRGKLLGGEKERAQEQLWARQDLAKEVRLLRAFEAEWSSDNAGNALTARLPYFGWTRLISNFESFKHKLRKQNPLAYAEAFPEDTP
jgi:hypothetical protein